MNNLKNERGSGLLLAIGVVVIFTVLGFSLLTLSASGIKKNETREDSVQAQKLSQMGLEFVSNEIFHKVQKGLGESGLPVSNYVKSLTDTLDLYLCFPTQMPNTEDTLTKIKNGTLTPHFKNVNASTGSGEYCILSYKDEILPNGKENSLRKDVVFLSYGTADSRNAYLVSTVKVGTDAVPDHLNYVVGTNVTSTNPQNGEGNLLLHGGVELKGDMKVEGNLLTSSNAYGGGQWVDSVRPRMLPSENKSKANMVLYGDAYDMTGKPGYDNHIKRNSFNNHSYKKVVNLDGLPAVEQLFHEGYTPSLVTRTPVKSPILITEEEPNYNFIQDANSKRIATTNKTITNQQYPSNKVVYAYQYDSCSNSGHSCTTHTTLNADFDLRGNNSFYGLAVKQDLNLKDNNTQLLMKQDIHNNGGTIYVGKNLNIGNQVQNDLSDKPDIYLNGAIYVNGDLNIQGAELYANALIYVNGNVKLKYSSVKGLQMGDKKGSIVIFAKGNIDISNNSVNTDPEKSPDTKEGPSLITGFFYSEGNFEMYGVGSNMIIDGGVSAKRIVLNGIRGRSSIGTYNKDLKQYSPNYYWERAENQNSRSSRLRIYYNPDIISTYSDLKQKEMVITHVDPNKIMEQQFR